MQQVLLQSKQSHRLPPIERKDDKIGQRDETNSAVGCVWLKYGMAQRTGPENAKNSQETDIVRAQAEIPTSRRFISAVQKDDPCQSEAIIRRSWMR